MNFGKRDLGLVLSETVGDADTLRFTRDERYAVESPNEKMRMAAASVAGSTHHSRAEQNPYIRRMPHLQYPILMECVIYSLLALHKSSQEDPATKLQIANVVAVALTLTRIIKSTVTGQAPVTLELGTTLGKNTNKPMMVLAYITADTIHASTRNI